MSHAAIAVRTGLSLVAGVGIMVCSMATIDGAGGDVRLVDAVKKADMAAVRSLLQQRADVNATSTDGTTALHWAVHQDDLASAALLLGAGANVQAADRYGVTPLSLACTNGNAPMIAALLKAGADPNVALPEGETPLMTAARSGNAAAVEALLDYGADMTAKENWRGQDALIWAAGEGHLEAVRTLVERGADLNTKSKDGYTPLMFAARQNFPDVVRFLVLQGASLNSTTTSGTGPLTLAIHNANWDIAGYLVEAGANVKIDAPGSTPLHLAIQIRNPDVESPFNAGAYVPTGKLTSLDVIKALIAHGADVNAPMTRSFPGLAAPKETPLAGATPFWLAAKGADPVVMRLLHEAGADPLVATKQKTTPLMAAAGVGYSQAISHGSEVEALEAVKVARELGGDVNAQNAMGYTALHGAAIRGANAIVEYLVSNGIRIDAKDKLGRTALTIAQLGAGDSTQRRQLQTATLLQTLMASAR